MADQVPLFREVVERTRALLVANTALSCGARVTSADWTVLRLLVLKADGPFGAWIALMSTWLGIMVFWRRTGPGLYAAIWTGITYGTYLAFSRLRELAYPAPGSAAKWPAGQGVGDIESSWQ